MPTDILRSSILIALLALPLTAQATYVVDDGPGGDFTSVSAALLQCVDGDSILVRPGHYVGWIQIYGLAVSIRAESGATFLGQLFVHGLEAGQEVHLDGLVMSGLGQTPGVLEGAGNRGRLVVRRSLFQGQGSGVNASPCAAKFTTCREVVLERCTLLAGSSEYSIPALSMVGSSVFMDRTLVLGAVGAPLGFPGSRGAELYGGELYAFRSSFQGGAGHSGDGFGCTTGGAGGAGLLLVGLGPRATLVGCSLAGGAGGVSLFGCGNGPDGPPAIVLSGQLRIGDWPTGIR